MKNLRPVWIALQPTYLWLVIWGDSYRYAGEWDRFFAVVGLYTLLVIVDGILFCKIFKK